VVRVAGRVGTRRRVSLQNSIYLSQSWPVRPISQRVYRKSPSKVNFCKKLSSVVRVNRVSRVRFRVRIRVGVICWTLRHGGGVLTAEHLSENSNPETDEHATMITSKVVR